jgi:predicted Zn-dependent protease
MKRLLLFFLILLLTGCATSPTGRSQLMLISPEQAIVASRDAYAQTLLPLQKKGKIDSNYRTTKRVRTITGKIIAQAIFLYPHTKDWGWSVKVIDAPKTVNAWCMAGGKMAIYTGLIDQIEATDDEIAQVMGHEISHALANHTAEKMSMAMASQLGLMGISLAAGSGAYSRVMVDAASVAASTAITLPNSRTSEAEADRIGIELAARAGYDPRAAVTLWEKMGKVGGAAPPEFLSTHPSPENRQKVLTGLADEMMFFYVNKVERPVYPLK